MAIDKNADKYQRIVVLVLLIIIAIPAIILSTADISPHKLIVKDNIVKVGVDSFKVADIKSVKLVDEINNIHRIKGTGTLTYIRGVCKIDGDNRDASVYIYKNKSPYIKIELEDGLLVYNDKNSSDTEKTYEKLCEIVDSNK